MGRANRLTTNCRPYAPTEQWLKDRLGDVANLVRELGSIVNGLPMTGELTGILKKFNVAPYIAALRNSKYLQYHISWNHGKVLAVNGKTMMTGGGNYWDEYTGIQHDIIDQQAKVTGEAAISAHRWADYFWRLVVLVFAQTCIAKWVISYLNKIPASDSQSFRRCAKLSESPKWTEEEAPLSPPFPTNIQYGDKKVLTISRIGDWHGKMTDVQYPVGIVDALRDALLNGVYLKFRAEGPEKQGTMTILTYVILTEDGEALRHLTEAAKIVKKLITNLLSD